MLGVKFIAFALVIIFLAGGLLTEATVSTCDAYRALVAGQSCRISFSDYSRDNEYKDDVICCAILDVMDCLKLAFKEQKCPDSVFFDTLTVWGLERIRIYIGCAVNRKYCDKAKLVF